MPRRCVVGNCSNTDIPSHSWPTKKPQAAAWNKFVDNTRTDKYSLSTKSAICCMHFEECCYANFMAWKNGYGFLRLIPGAVPTIKNCMDHPLKQDILDSMTVLTGKGKDSKFPD